MGTVTTGAVPYGPREFDLARLSPEQFEFLCQLLVRIEFPQAIATEDPDGGADALLAASDGTWERGWQAKRFTGSIRWPQCRRSVDDALASYQIRHMTFCFARDLTVGQLRTWQRLVTEYPSVRLDFWAKAHLTSLLIGSMQGQRIANTFFAAPPPSASEINRILRAGVLLETGADVLDRVLALVEQAVQRDPDYEYAFHGFETGHASPLTPGTVIAVTQVNPDAESRIDAIPRPEGLASTKPPTLMLTFDEDEAGQRAAAAFDRALHASEPTTVSEGFIISPSNLPALFTDLIGAPHRAAVTLTPELPAPWEIACDVVTDRGSASFPLVLRRVEAAEEQGLRMIGIRSGVTMQLDLRPHGEMVRVSVNFSHRLDDSTLVEHVDALRFLSATCGAGTLTIRDVSERISPIVGRSASCPFEAEGTLRLLDDLLYVQAVSEVTFRIPETITGEEAAWIRTAAEVFRTGRTTLRWPGMVISGEHDEALPAEEGAVRIEQELTLQVLGHDITLGRGVLDIPRVQLIDQGFLPEDPMRRVLEIRPPGGDPIEVEWQQITAPGSG
jgi:hypothetical protein